MGFREWLGFSVREASDPSTALTIPRRDQVTQTVSSGDALGLSMAFRAIQIHAVSIKQLSLGVYRNDEQIDTPLFIRKPDIDSTRSAFLETAVVSLACTGNAYWRIIRNDSKQVTSLQPLNPLDITIEKSTSGRISKYKQTAGPDLNPDEVKQLKLLRVPGSAYGLGPIQAAQRELRGALDLRDYASYWFQDAAVPTGVLKSEQVLNTEQAKQAREAWENSQGARRGVAVLGNGLSYASVYLSPRDAQFLENQQFTVTQIARLFGVPSSLMLASVQGSTDTYQNVSQDWLGYVRFSLMAYLIEIEDALSELLPRGQEAKFNVEALLRSDTTTRYAAHKTALEAKFMSVAEVRKIENLPPLEGDSNA